MTKSFQHDEQKIVWKLHLRSPKEKVYRFLATDEGRAKWWAESALEKDGKVEFIFKNDIHWHGEIYSRIENEQFSLNYFGSKVTFLLESVENGGTDLIVCDEISIDGHDRVETTAGWVSALMAMKAAVDFDVDLRNHDSKRSWKSSYCDN